MKMKWLYLTFIPVVLTLIPTCLGACVKLKDLSGYISDKKASIYSYTSCWDIEVPKDKYIRLNIKQTSFYGADDCAKTRLTITAPQTKEDYRYCFKSKLSSESVTAKSNVNIEFYNGGTGNSNEFSISYHIEDQICAEDNHFRCSNHSCTLESKVCDGVKDCPNGIDEIGCALNIKGLHKSRENAVKWLNSQRSASYDWGKNTHRAITTLYLANAASFLGQNLEEELIAKELELETSLALLKNSTERLSISELSMFIDALAVTCHDPRQFYGFDLLKILAERESIEKSPSPRAYLTLCNLNWDLTESDVRRLLKVLYIHSEYPFTLDVQAVTMMALTCTKFKMEGFSRIENALNTYNATIDRFISGQLSDGSFGNVYTTGLITQALIASKQEVNPRWNVTATMQYLMNQLNTSVDFLSASLAIPIFTARSLVDLDKVDCSNSSRKQEDDGISDLTGKIGEKRRIKFSLYIGDDKDIIHTMYLRVPDNSTVYDVMRIAQVADAKYKFLHREVSKRMYIYEIAGITNDPEAGKFWLLYTEDTDMNGTMKHHFESPDQLYLGDVEHLIMWYKSAYITE